ncbi:hypothetical protein [Sulfurimonas sp.]|uniref:hypothetical protein n=1 Tax=Sulfurimonas sp. TaxID=2022749 RepID=UPI003D10B1C9
MGYFDALSEALFKEDENGNTIFYKWGIMGRGVVVDTQEKKDQIISLTTIYYTIVFAFIFIMNFSIFIYHIDIVLNTVIFLGIGVVLTLWYLYQISKITKGLEYSQTKLSMYDSWKKTSHRLPKYVLWGGFILMSLLVVLAIFSFFLDDFPLWIGTVLLVLGIFGSFAYYKMIIFSKDAPVPIPDVPPVQAVPQETSEKAMEWNLKNSSIVFSVLAVVLGFVYYVYADSKQEYDEKMAMYEKMTTQEMAAHLAEVNAEPTSIDFITMHAGTKAENNRIYFYRELKSNPISDMVVDVEHAQDDKVRMSKKLKREMCDSPAFNLFYKKGGELLFVYNLVKDEQKTFLFDVKIDKEFCL